MKVLHLSPSFPPAIGGVETLVAHLAAWQQAQGHDVIVLCGTIEDTARTESWGGLIVHRLPFFQPLTAKDVAAVATVQKRMQRLAEAFDPDVIHLHPTAVDMVFMRNLVRRVPRPTLTTLHTDFTWMTDSYRTNLRTVLDLSAAIAAISPAQRDDAGTAFPDHATRLHLVENGVAAMPETAPPAPDRFLYLGRLSHEKGVDIALRAMALLAERGRSIGLTIAGDGLDRAGLEDLAHDLNLGDSVTFLGSVPRDDTPSLLSGHAALVVPSRWREPFGLVVAEAAMAARPAIVSAKGALGRLVKDGVTGLHVPPEDPAALAGALAALADTPQRAAALGRAAQAKARRDWSIDRMGRSYDDLYRRLAASP